MKTLMLVALATVPLLTVAQTDVAPAAEDIDNLVVTATRVATDPWRLPAAVQIIDRQAIDLSGAANLAELLRSHGGVELLDFYGDGSRVNVGLRGFGENAGSNTLVLVDGQPLNNPDIGAPDLGRLSLADIERVEILHGGNAWHGDQAVGGVIHILTRSPATRSATAELNSGSFAEQGLRLESSAQFGDLGLRLGASSEGSDNYRDHNALERHRGHLLLEHRGENTGWRLAADFISESLETPGALFADEQQADRRQSAADFAADFSDQKTLDLRAQLGTGFGPHWRLHTALGLRQTEGDFRLSFRGFASDPASQDRDLWTLQLRAERALPGAAVLGLGLDADRADYRLSSQFGEQLNEQHGEALWASLHWPLAATVDLATAMRQSWVEDELRDTGDFAALPDGQSIKQDRGLGSLGLNWRPHQNLKLFVAWDQVLRYPKVDEYFGSGFTPDTIGLRPQTGDSLELGARLRAADWEVGLLVYQLDLDNEIVFDPVSFANTNLARSRRHGVVLDGHWQLSRQLRLSGAVTWQDPELRSGTQQGKQIPLVADSLARLRLAFAPQQGWSAELEWLASSERVLGGDFDNSLPRLSGYGILNAGIRHRREAWELRLAADNLLGREYAELGVETSSPTDFSEVPAYFPLPKARVRVQLRRKF